MKCKKLQLILLSFSYILMFGSISFAQKQTLEELNLNGSVKLYEVKVYAAAENDNTIKKEIPIWLEHEFVKFNDKGIKTEENFYDANNKHIGKALFYIYKEENYTKTIFTDSIGKIAGYDIYKYNQGNDLIQVTSYDKNDFVTDSVSYTNKNNFVMFDNNGNKTEEAIFNSYGEKEGKLVYKYNDSQLLIEVSNYKSDNRIISNVVHNYDANKNIIESKFYVETPPLIETKTIVKNGVEYTEETVWGTEDITLEKTMSYSYKYDAMGNWIQKITFENNKPIKLMEREIKY